MAYYVVYLHEKQKFVVVPAAWIKDIERHYEKFINNSLNRSQIFLCFHPDESSEAFIDGRPDVKYIPDFQPSNCSLGKLKRYYERYGDALSYIQQLRNVEPAVYNHRRLTELPIPDINSQIVDTASIDHESNPNDSFESHVSEEENSRLNDPLVDQLSPTVNGEFIDEVSINETTNSLDMNEMDPLSDSTENVAIDTASMNETSNAQTQSNGVSSVSTDETTNDGNDQSVGQLRIVSVESLAKPTGDEGSNCGLNRGAQDVTDEDLHAAAQKSTGNIQSDPSERTGQSGNNEKSHQNSESDPLDTVVKNEYVPLFNNNNAEIDQLLDEPENLSDDDDVIIIVGPSGIPKPLPSAEKILTKRENDVISGNIPFNETGNGRVYKIGEKLIEIPKKVVEKIIEWNGTKRDDIQYDRKVCHSLLLSLVAKEQLQVVDDAVMKFIKDCFIIRCSTSASANAQDRIDRIDVYKDELSIKLCGAVVAAAQSKK